MSNERSERVEDFAAKCARWATGGAALVATPQGSTARCLWRRVADLPLVWRTEMDQRCFPATWIKWVASPGYVSLRGDRPAVCELRYRALLALHDSRGVDWPAFRALKAVTPDLRYARPGSGGQRTMGEAIATEQTRRALGAELTRWRVPLPLLYEQGARRDERSKGAR